VEEGRGLSAKAVAKVAKGRVWTGEQALELGLVDRLGGLAEALALAKEQAGLPLEEGAVRIKQVYPKHKSPLSQMVKLARGESQEGGAGGAPEAAPAAAAAAWAAAAAPLGLQLTAGEWALLQQLHSGSLAPQCVDPVAERLAASL
jgi:protease-4